MILKLNLQNNFNWKEIRMSSGKGRRYSFLAFFFFFILFISSEVTAARKLKMVQKNGEFLFILWSMLCSIENDCYYETNFDKIQRERKDD